MMEYQAFTEVEVRPHRVARAIPWSETCFGCNEAIPGGLGVRAYATEDGCIAGLCTAKETHMGFPGVIHGGILSTYFDEVLWHATRLADPETVAMTVEMAVHYLRPVRPGQKLRVIALPAKIEGRHIYVDGYMLLPDDRIACTARCHYVAVRRENTLNGEERQRLHHEQTEKIESIVF